MSKKLLSERDICTKFISPAIENAGFNKLTQYLEEVSFTDGRIYFVNLNTIIGETKIEFSSVFNIKPVTIN